MISKPSRGLVLVDKPAGMTSHDVVARLRRIYGQKRIGHAGTLDPGATGLLVIAIGNITRLLDYFQAKTKRYVGDVVFGIETDSYDSDGTVVARSPVESLDLPRLDEAVSRLQGDISQLPPIVSALKLNGKRLYQYHRESLEVEIKPRQVRIDSIAYSTTDEPNVIHIEVVCSPGTYIRSIAHDLGAALEIGAHLRNLRRLESGSFRVEDAYSLGDLTSDAIMDPISALSDFTVRGLNSEQAARARNGSMVGLPDEGIDCVLLFDAGDGPLVNWDQLIGLYQRDSGDRFRASVILPLIN
ncbi:MAG: tRNA pseudouridine(55) synthase TruB [Acidimicrobiaceae bacterium]|nr:tRNA pseudouridine(55) synthase TruB [Acidimicrobiaceae bacterium]